MRRILASVALALLLAGSTVNSTTHAETKVAVGPCAGHKITAGQFRAFSAAVWSPSRWERGAPPHKTIAAERHKLRCAAGPGHRKAMKATWRRDRSAFYQRRSSERELIALTPYDCGSAGRFAIPCSVVACESGYDWGAVNEESGAFSAYQFLPSTYEEVCRACDGSKRDLHYAAGVVWARSGGSEWVCA